MKTSGDYFIIAKIVLTEPGDRRLRTGVLRCPTVSSVGGTGVEAGGVLILSDSAKGVDGNQHFSVQSMNLLNQIFIFVV
jgi:hypothetical protein